MGERFNRSIHKSAGIAKSARKNFVGAAETFASELSLDAPFRNNAYLGTGTQWSGMGKAVGNMGMLDKAWFGGRVAVDFLTGADMPAVTGNLDRAGSWLGAAGPGGASFQDIRDMAPSRRSQAQKDFFKSHKKGGFDRMSGGEWGGKRIGRAVSRNAAVMGGLAVADFLNPFSPGWND